MFQPRFYRAFIPGIAKGATNQKLGRRRPPAGGDHVAGQVGASEMPEHSVYRVDEFETRIDSGFTSRSKISSFSMAERVRIGVGT